MKSNVQKLIKDNDEHAYNKLIEKFDHVENRLERIERAIMEIAREIESFRRQ